MAARGSYAKGVAKRDEILRTALTVIAANGYSKTSIRDLAAAVGLSQTGLLHYFGTKEELFVEILRKRDEDVTEHSSSRLAADPNADGARTLIDGLVDVGRQNTEVPGLVQLYAQFSTEAAEAGHPAHEYFRERYAEYRRRVAESIREQQQLGRLPTRLDADRVAALLAAATDGLQTQWMLENSIDMADHIRYLWTALVGDAYPRVS